MLVYYNSQRTTHDPSRHQVPTVITNSPPFPINVDLHATRIRRNAIYQAHIAGQFIYSMNISISIQLIAVK